jgi:ATP-binding cassette subfamily F protein 3
MHSVDLLIEALNRYEGSYILVSHDRYFISKTANKIWSIEDGKIVEFKGGYEEWVAWNERMQKAEQQKTRPRTEKSDREVAKQEVPVRSETVVKSAPIDKEKQKEQRRLEKRFGELETLINDLNRQKAETEGLLADPAVYMDKKKFPEAEKRYQELAVQLSKAEGEYEKVFEALSSFTG